MTPELKRAHAVLRVAEDKTLSRDVKIEIVAHHLAQMRSAPAPRKRRPAGLIPKARCG